VAQPLPNSVAQPKPERRSVQYSCTGIRNAWILFIHSLVREIIVSVQGEDNITIGEDIIELPVRSFIPEFFCQNGGSQCGWRLTNFCALFFCKFLDVPCPYSYFKTASGGSGTSAPTDAA
jgi:hypothetical protein